MNKDEIAEFEEMIKKLPTLEKKVKDNTIKVRVDGGLFRAVMSVAYQYGNKNMSEVSRRCIAKALDEVSKDLKREKEAREKELSKFV
jgi:pentose-5-phosphate-3-epimerase